MEQLVQPNLSVVGTAGLCLGYVQTVFNVPSSDPHYYDAWQAWQNTQLKHLDQNFPSGVSFPVWFSWSGTINGVTQNWGHVAVYTPSGIYTSPLSGTGHLVYPSISALESAFGVKYVGWSEDIETLRVIEEVAMPTEQDVINQFNAFKGSPPTAAEIAYYITQPWNALNNALLVWNRDMRLHDEGVIADLQQKIDNLTSANLKLADQITALKAKPVVDPAVTVSQSGLWAAFKRILGL